ncbi:hypothetical protein A2335_02960 [Candidatus Peregrinibacteria bacterium RIFOXYB2_FULL_32_7]|nr:MAG: hypothetical protein A2335_02960 [Candidatus Peregrinibacteria bacterium RIFOXYB2_FULL_32_7]OGY87419.1 MAG: hypothetical protein A2233_00695 [Candidatus Kerfeldbacteria bacterium RIFOXYA2_FULL_38_24]
MRSIERRFRNIEKQQMHWSTYVCFAEAIRGQQFSRNSIVYWFNHLVDKSDYARNDKKAILEHLYILSECVRNGQN